MIKKNTSTPSPVRSSAEGPVDMGKKSKIRKQDKAYKKKEADFGNIARNKENEEQPVHPVKEAPQTKTIGQPLKPNRKVYHT